MGRTELILFVALILTGVSVYLFLATLMNNNNEKDLLAWAKGEERPPTKSKIINSSIPLVHQFTMKYALKIKSTRYRKKVENILMTAGMSRQLSVDEFIGLRLLYGIMFPCFLFVMNFALEMGFPFLIFLVLIPLGYYLPDIHAKGIRDMRTRSVQLDLPFFIDLLALSTEAGLDFINAIQRIVDKAENSALGEELSIVLKDIKLGASRIESLRGMAKRLDMNEITSFVAVLADADATGASISTVLKDQSIQMRLERFVRAEKAGARASQLILLPIMVFIIPAVFIMVFGPVILQFMGGGAK
jgi:tight adherence protein C